MGVSIDELDHAIKRIEAARLDLGEAARHLERAGAPPSISSGIFATSDMLRDMNHYLQDMYAALAGEKSS
jgi:hypothetical protein